MMSRQLELHKLNTGRECRVQMAATKLVNFLFQYGGYIGAYLIIGGYDVNGPHLVSISAHGKYANLLFASFFIYGFLLILLCSSMWLPYTSLGSGSLAATAILETHYRDDLPVFIFYYFFVNILIRFFASSKKRKKL